MSGPQSSRKLPFAIHTRARQAPPQLRDDIKNHPKQQHQEAFLFNII